MTDPIVVLCLLLTTGTLAVLGAGNDKYRREDGTFTNTPPATVAAASVINCAARCNSKEPWFCGGFTYHNGACDLYRDEADTASNALEVDAGSEPRSYRRLKPSTDLTTAPTSTAPSTAPSTMSTTTSVSACPGKVHCGTSFD